MDDGWGGPLAQAEFAGSGVGIFGTVAFFFFLPILQQDTSMREREEEEKRRNERIVAKSMNFN